MIDPETAFFLIRHGETSWNHEGRLQGQRDIPLNRLGREQAGRAGRRLAKTLRQRGLSDPDALRYVSSPLSRALHTMQLLRAAMTLRPDGYAVDDRLKELSFGDWEGHTWPEVRALSPAAVRERKRDKWAFVPPGGESYAMLADRLLPWLATVHKGDVIVAHGGVVRVLMHLVAGIPCGKVTDLEIRQGRVVIFEKGRCRWA